MEATYKRTKTYVKTDPAKAPEELFETDIFEGGNFTLPHCQKTFTEYPNIRKHIGPFHAEKRFSCTVCTKSFTGGDKLKTHLVRHSEAKDFMCDDCGEQCKRKDKLGEHGKRRHNVLSKKERPIVVSTVHQAVYETRDQ